MDTKAPSSIYIYDSQDFTLLYELFRVIMLVCSLKVLLEFIGSEFHCSLCIVAILYTYTYTYIRIQGGTKKVAHICREQFRISLNDVKISRRYSFKTVIHFIFIYERNSKIETLTQFICLKYAKIIENDLGFLDRNFVWLRGIAQLTKTVF